MRPRGGAVRGFFARSLVVRGCAVLLLFCFVAPFLYQSYSSSHLPPRSFTRVPPAEPDCHDLYPPVSLDNNSFCTGACKSECFPRVRDVCFSARKIRICVGQGTNRRIEEIGDNGLIESGPSVPNFMRFYGERLTVGVEYSNCNEGWHWISGLSAVADQRFLPYQKPNPHHEAEKLIPSVLLAKFYDSKLHWFASPADVSEWAKGFLIAVGMEKKVRYLTLPSREDDSICFHDAVLLSSPTNLRYVPDQGTNQWLRQKVLDYCQLPVENSSWPVRSAMILDRLSGPRRLRNKRGISEVVSQVLQVPVIEKISGMGTFCEQVAPVTQADLFVVPHGSQNVVMLFARPGAIIVEVMPYLFYTEALRNFTHAAQVKVHALLGMLPPGDWKLWLFSLFGWDFCFHNLRLCKNHARRQPIYADLIELEKVLGVIQRANGSFA